MTIRKSVTIAASADAVFAALTQPSLIVRHFPFDHVTSDAEVGGSFRLQGTHDGKPFTDHGIITAFEPGRVFAYRYWSDNHGTERKPDNELTICYRLEAAAGGATILTVEHGNIRDEAYRQIMEGAWDFLLAGLRDSRRLRGA